jgi:dsDNA-specific endonuclease/ATPase MutS2
MTRLHRFLRRLLAPAGSAPSPGMDNPAKADTRGGTDETAGAEEDAVSADPVALPIDGVLDLHAFDPREVGPLLDDYLESCRERGILEVRVIHGKGTGALRATVRARLERHPAVVSVRAADETAGGWGATLVTLARRLS